MSRDEGMNAASSSAIVEHIAENSMQPMGQKHEAVAKFESPRRLLSETFAGTRKGVSECKCIVFF